MSTEPALASPGTLAPRPSGALPLLGDFWWFRRDPLRFLPRAARECGPVVRVSLGPLTAHVAAHPDAVKRVLQENHKNYAKQSVGYRKIREFLGNGLLTSEGEFWLRQRRIAQPAFHRARIAALGDEMTAAAERACERWGPVARSGATLNVAAEMMRVTLEIVGTTLFGIDVSDAVERVGRATDVLLAEMDARIANPFVLPPSVPTPRNKRLLAARDALDEIVYGAIAARRSAPADAPPRADLLSLLLAARDEDTGEGMTDVQLRDEVMTLFLAGHETTANALAWTWYLLSKHPSVARALRDELASVLGGRSARADDYPALPYTRAVLQESMRLYPPAWIMGRLAVADDALMGRAIPANTMVFVSPYVTHRLPEFWPNPEGFDPERFRDERQVSARPAFAYFPFGGGPRLCIGNQFAMMEAVLILATMAQRFRVDVLAGARVEPQPLITLRPRGGLPATLTALRGDG